MITDNYLALVMIGRLGNQLGSLAAALSYAWDNGLTLVCPQLMNHPLPAWVDKIAIPQGYDFKPKTIFWPGMCYDYLPVYEKLIAEFPYIASPFPENNLSKIKVHSRHGFVDLNIEPNMLLIGYFFSEGYFFHYKDRIKNLFQPSDTVLRYLMHKYGDIICNKKSVGIHYRDFTGDGDAWVPKLTEEHFLTAIESFDDSHKFYVCSNNLNYAESFFKDIFRKTNKHVNFIRRERDFIDFYFLSQLHNIIISNSSFGWWTGYLCPHEDRKIIAPRDDKWMHPELFSDDLTVLPKSENWHLL